VRPSGGPTLINLIHELDSLRFICGEVRSVFAQSSSAIRGLEVEDSLSATLTFENGVLGSILASDATPAPWSYEMDTGENIYYFHTDENCYRFFGTKGSLAFPQMELWRYTDETREGWQHAMEMTRCETEHAVPLVRQLRSCINQRMLLVSLCIFPGRYWLFRILKALLADFTLGEI
jgi:predicted dehydrogenase